MKWNGRDIMVNVLISSTWTQLTWYFVCARWFHFQCHVTFEKTAHVETPTPRRTTKESATGPLAELHTSCGTQGACWETILLYMLLIRGPFHSHRTPTCPRFLIKQQQLKRVWHSNKQPTKHINNRFCKGYDVEVLWMTYGNSNHRCCQTKAQTSLDWRFCFFMFAFIDHYL